MATGCEQSISEGEASKVQKQIKKKKCSKSSAMQETQMTFGTQEKWYTFHTSNDDKTVFYKRCWQKRWRNWNPLHCWWDYKTVQPLWKTVRKFLKTLKTEWRSDPAIPLLGVYPKELKSGFQSNLCPPVFTAAIFTIAKRRETSECPSMDEWIKKKKSGMCARACVCVCVCAWVCVYTQWNIIQP